MILIPCQSRMLLFLTVIMRQWPFGLFIKLCIVLTVLLQTHLFRQEGH